MLLYYIRELSAHLRSIETVIGGSGVIWIFLLYGEGALLETYKTHSCIRLVMVYGVSDSDIQECDFLIYSCDDRPFYAMVKSYPQSLGDGHGPRDDSHCSGAQSCMAVPRGKDTFVNHAGLCSTIKVHEKNVKYKNSVM